MFLKKIIIENFKGFGGKTEIDFNFPNQKNNGLNFFIGENNTGKSTVFEAVNFLFSGLPKGSNEDDLKNKNNKNNPVIVKIEMLGNSLDNLRPKYEKYIQKLDDGMELIKLGRSSEKKVIDQGGKKSVDMNIKKLGVYNFESLQYENPTGFDKSFKQYFDIDFIWADTNPEEITKFGSTTIVGKLISKISEGFKDSQEYIDFEKKYNEVFNDGENSLKSKLNEIGQDVETTFKEQFGDAKINFHFENLDVSSYFKNTKIEVDDGTKTFLDEKGSGMQRAIALTLLQVYINMLPESEEKNKKPFYFFIDEPEICLHPKAQIKLIKALNKLSETQQIFLTTHSPYIFKETGGKLKKVNIFTKEDETIKIQNTAENFGLFGKYSPSWGEINYYAYNLPTVEFHNELYGYLEIKNKIELNEIDKTKKWVKDKNGIKGKEIDVSLQEYIRHSIHHPENNHNDDYSEEELDNSIQEMIKILNSLKNQGPTNK
ncbi:ATP-dependent nuclease [Candidatus Vampirococcus lugosii]|uniref:ATPase n=1 Tax=Candidatus Vampirococcus lugosii TaxID=2789015 RepID=A0ABS5QL22_9BACT|nr:AAA family ATPase [Candidatus Vampirococcus lugosii]MBS8121905.1 putative ATPase [Candidatus Vampirococcus lugosii]